MSRLYKAFKLSAHPCSPVTCNTPIAVAAVKPSKRTRFGNYILNKFTRATTNIGSWFHRPHDKYKPSRFSSSRFKSSRFASKLVSKAAGPYTAKQTMAESLHFPSKFTYYNRPSTLLLAKSDWITWKSAMTRTPVLISRNFTSSALPDSEFTFGHYLRTTRRAARMSSKLLTWSPQPRNQVASSVWQVKTNGKKKKGKNNKKLDLPVEDSDKQGKNKKKKRLPHNHASQEMFRHDTSNIKRTNIFDILLI